MHAHHAPKLCSRWLLALPTNCCISNIVGWLQVKPFILRRTKDTVLADLPPKILQDVFVEASPLQRSLFQDFAASDATQEVQGALQAGDSAHADKAPHVFQVCHHLCKPLVCSRPPVMAWLKRLMT